MKTSKYLALIALSLIVSSPALAEDPAPTAVKYVSVNSSEETNKNNDGAKAKNSIAIGSSTTSKENAIVLGKNAKSYQINGIALGTNAQVGAANNKYANVSDSIAIGTNSYAYDRQSIALGSMSTARLGLALGHQSYAANYGTAVGQEAMAIGQSSVAYGKGAQALEWSVSIGSGSLAHGRNSVVVGAGSTIDKESLKYTVKYESKNNEPANREVKNSHFSGNSDNAVIVGRNNSIENSSNSRIIGANNTITSSSYSTILASKSTLSEASTAFVAGSGVKVTGSRSVIAIGSGLIVENSNDAIVMGTSAKVGGYGSLAMGWQSNALGKAVVSMGYEAGRNFDTNYSVIIGHQANRYAKPAVDKVVALGSKTYAIQEGAVALGSGSVAARGQDIAGYDPMTAKDSTETKAVWKSTTGIASIGTSTMSRQLTGLAAGWAENDAVNVAQLKALAKKAQADLASVTGMSPEDVAALTSKGAEGQEKPKTLIERLNDKADASATTPTGKIAKDDAGAVSGGTVFDAIEKLKKELAAENNTGKPGTITDGKGNSTSVQPGAIIVGKDGKDGKDGANGTTITNEGVVVKGKDGKDGKDGTSTLGKDGLTVAGKDGRDGKDGANATAQVKPGQVTLTGDNGNDSANLTPEKLVFAGKDGKDGKNGMATYGRDGLTITGPAGADGAPGKTIVINADTVDMGGNRVQNVADGVAPTDAVNKRQLDALRDELSAGGADGLAAVKRLEKKSSRGDAMGAALAALKPLDFNPLKPHQFMAGYGNYSGTSAIALGFGTYNETGDRFLHAGLAYGGNSDLSFNAGVSFQFGTEEDEKGTKVVTTNSLSAMNQQMQQLKAENEELKRQVKLLMDKAGLN